MFTCETRRDGARTVVVARGEIDLSSCDDFWDVLQPLIVANAAVAVECSELSFIDSQGIAILILARNRAEAVGARLHLAAPSPMVLRVLELVGITEMFTLTPGSEGASAVRAPAVTC